jgi:hypothetical protein
MAAAVRMQVRLAHICRHPVKAIGHENLAQ